MSSEDAALSSLLEEESFLVKIFSCLLEHGLHECRLVCKKWYEVSKRLPVKLSPTLTDKASLNRMEKFPNVRAVVLDRGLREKDPIVVRETTRLHPSQRFRLEADVFRFLASLKNLRHLSIRGMPNCVPSDCVEECYRSLSRLLSLDLGRNYIGPDYAAAMSFLTHLDELTALTVFDISNDDHEGLMPLTSLSKIQKLEL
ncbi:MAG: F-box protein, partial [Pseudomonadales bacterium]|nr:F-box protein [Pseudomonadales bacterium]